MLELIGWIGGICFALCAIPQAYKSWKDGHSEGITWGLLILWIVGEVFSLVYVWPTQKWPLIVNYASALLWTSIITWYKIFSRGEEGDVRRKKGIS